MIRSIKPSWADAVALALLVLLGSPSGARAADASSDDPGALAAEILSRDGYQTELPGAAGRAGAEERSPLLLEPRSRASGWRIPVPDGLGALLEILVWIGAAAIVVAVLVLAVRMALEAIGERRRRAPAGEAPKPTTAAPRRAPPLGRADELAAAGRFTEAVHVLLVRALAALGARRGRAFPDSATSREILASDVLAPGQRVPLEALVEPVERSVFGGAALGAEDWERCRSAFRALEVEA